MNSCVHLLRVFFNGGLWFVCCALLFVPCVPLLPIRYANEDVPQHLPDWLADQPISMIGGSQNFQKIKDTKMAAVWDNRDNRRHSSSSSASNQA